MIAEFRSPQKLQAICFSNNDWLFVVRDIFFHEMNFFYGKNHLNSTYLISEVLDN